MKQLQNPDEVLETIVDLVVRLAEHGLIHCDFNEFNIMVWMFLDSLLNDVEESTSFSVLIFFQNI